MNINMYYQEHNELTVLEDCERLAIAEINNFFYANEIGEMPLDAIYVAALAGNRVEKLLLMHETQDIARSCIRRLRSHVATHIKYYIDVSVYSPL